MPYYAMKQALPIECRDQCNKVFLFISELTVIALVKDCYSKHTISNNTGVFRFQLLFIIIYVLAIWENGCINILYLSDDSACSWYAFFIVKTLHYRSRRKSCTNIIHLWPVQLAPNTALRASIPSLMNLSTALVYDTKIRPETSCR